MKFIDLVNLQFNRYINGVEQSFQSKNKFKKNFVLWIFLIYYTKSINLKDINIRGQVFKQIFIKKIRPLLLGQKDL